MASACIYWSQEPKESHLQLLALVDNLGMLMEAALSKGCAVLRGGYSTKLHAKKPKSQQGTSPQIERRETASHTCVMIAKQGSPSFK